MTTKLALLNQIEKWSEIYNFTFQFWGEGNNNVFIEKDGVELISFGGGKNIEAILTRTLDWAREKNPNGIPKADKPKPYKKANSCLGCGCGIAEGNNYCGECLCEDDSDYY